MKYSYDIEKPLHIFFNENTQDDEKDSEGNKIKNFSGLLEKFVSLQKLEIEYNLEKYLLLLKLFPDELEIFTWIHPNIKQSMRDSEHSFPSLIIADTIKNSYPEIKFNLISRHPAGAPKQITDHYTVHPITVLNKLAENDLTPQKIGEIRGKVFQDSQEIDDSLVSVELDKVKIGSLIDSINLGYKEFIKVFDDVQKNQKETGASHNMWIKFLFPNPDLYIKPFEENPFWKKLPQIHSLTRIIEAAKNSTPIYNQYLESIKEDLDFNTQNNYWEVSFRFFESISSRIKNEDDIITVAMMYLIHETVHFEKHGFSSQTVSGETENSLRDGNDMGNYPNCIEEADYQADVYALLTCLSYLKHKSNNASDTFDFKAKFLELIKLAVETTFSFIRTIPFSRNQVRRVNRTLIWVFIYQIINEKIESDKIKQFEFIMNLIAKKPVVEIYGPDMYTVNHRTFYNFKEMKSQLWLGTFYNNNILRFPMPQKDSEKIIIGIKQAKFENICDGMSSFFEYVFPKK